MMNQNNSFPMYFTLEHVSNGYILKAKEDTGSLTQEPAFRKEVVTEDKIEGRIGRLLHLDAIAKERPIMFRVEATTENMYKTDMEDTPDNLMEAKVAYAHFAHKEAKNGAVVALVIADTQTIEVYGLDAERLAKVCDMKTTHVGGIPVLKIADSKDSRKHIASVVSKIEVLEVTHKAVLKWYSEHKVILEPKPVKEKKTDKSAATAKPANEAKTK